MIEVGLGEWRAEKVGPKASTYLPRSSYKFWETGVLAIAIKPCHLKGLSRTDMLFKVELGRAFANAVDVPWTLQRHPCCLANLPRRRLFTITPILCPLYSGDQDAIGAS